MLVDAANQTVWQSLDHPTDALLVGQPLRPGARLTANASGHVVPAGQGAWACASAVALGQRD